MSGTTTPGSPSPRSWGPATGTGHRDTDDREVGSPATAEACAATSEVSGVRVVTLDSLVPGAVSGRIGAEQLGWLREVLARPAPAGTVVALHHPPISVSPEWAAASLQDAVELADVLRGSDVHAVLCGHVHAQISGFLVGVPVWVGPGVITRIDLTAPRGLVRAVRGAAAMSWTSADLTARCSTSCTPVIPTPGSRCTWPTAPPGSTSTTRKSRGPERLTATRDGSLGQALSMVA